MTTLQKIALVVAVIAIALGAYVTFVLGNSTGTIAMGLGAMCAALSAAVGGASKKGRGDARR